MTNLLTKRGRQIFKLVIINMIIFITCLICLELVARLFLRAIRGHSTAGLAARSRHLGYQPFVMFGDDWDQKLQQQLTQLYEKDIYNIIILGGSTAAAFPGKKLESQLAELNRNVVFKVTNLSYSGYNARQEAIVATLWVPELEPDLIITLDGANDIIHRIRMNGPGTFYLNDTYKLSLTKPFLNPFAEIMRHSQLFHGLQRLKVRNTIKVATEYVDCIPIYLSAIHSINVIAKGLGANRIMILQPHMAFKKPLMPQEQQFTAYQYRENVVKALYSEAHRGLSQMARQDEVIYLDGRYLYQGLEEQIFRDDVHFADERGYEILISEIVRLATTHRFIVASPLFK